MHTCIDKDTQRYESTYTQTHSYMQNKHKILETVRCRHKRTCASKHTHTT